MITKEDLHLLITRYYEDIRQEIAKEAPKTTRLDVPIGLKDFDKLSNVQAHVKDTAAELRKKVPEEYEKPKIEKFFDYLEILGLDIGCIGFMIQKKDLNETALNIYEKRKGYSDERWKITQVPPSKKSNDAQKRDSAKLRYIDKQMESLSIQLALDAINEDIVYRILEKKYKKQELEKPDERILYILNMTFHTSNKHGEYVPDEDAINMGYISCSDDKETEDHELTHAYVESRLSETKRVMIEAKETENKKYESARNKLEKDIDDIENALHTEFPDYGTKIISIRKEKEEMEKEIERQEYSDEITPEESVNKTIDSLKHLITREDEIRQEVSGNARFEVLYGEIEKLKNTLSELTNQHIDYEPIMVWPSFSAYSIDAIDEGGAHAISRGYNKNYTPNYEFYEKKHGIKREYLQAAFERFSELSQNMTKDQLRHMIADVACEAYRTGTDAMKILDMKTRVR